MPDLITRVSPPGIPAVAAQYHELSGRPTTAKTRALSHRLRWGLSAFTVALTFMPQSRALAADALQEYLQTPDTTFTWKTVKEMATNDFTVVQLEMFSQNWRSNLWRHHMQIVRPSKVRNPDLAYLFITGDGDGKRYIGMLQTIASQAGVVAAVVTKIPNQPLYEGRKEDALIAYTFDRYLKTGDRTWPLLFPMVKSAVRAMDAVQQQAEKEHGQKIERFVVSGASKRGWTTWLTGASDARVKGIAPMVIDMLNMKAQTDWAEKAYGKQSEMIHDYVDLNLVGRMDDRRMVELRSWVDPYAYRARYQMPKLILLGTNDPYWVVDSLRHYWEGLPEPKLVYQTPNAGHDLGGGRDATQTLAAFVEIIADRKPLPTMHWQFGTNENAELSIKVDPPGSSARLWTADSIDRDFRNEKWSNRTLEVPGAKGQISATIAKPDTGYRAYLGEVTLKSPSGRDYKLSTEARVVPDGLK